MITERQLQKETKGNDKSKQKFHPQKQQEKETK